MLKAYILILLCSDSLTELCQYYRQRRIRAKRKAQERAYSSFFRVLECCQCCQKHSLCCQKCCQIKTAIRVFRINTPFSKLCKLNLWYNCQMSIPVLVYLRIKKQAPHRGPERKRHVRSIKPEIIRIRL